MKAKKPVKPCKADAPLLSEEQIETLADAVHSWIMSRRYHPQDELLEVIRKAVKP